MTYVGPHVCFERTTNLCCKDHPSICGFIWTVYLCCKDQLSFVILKNQPVLLKPQGGPTDTNSQNMPSNLNHPIILHSLCMFCKFQNTSILEGMRDPWMDACYYQTRCSWGCSTNTLISILKGVYKGKL